MVIVTEEIGRDTLITSYNMSVYHQVLVTFFLSTFLDITMLLLQFALDLPQQAVLGPYFLNDFSASFPPKHCPPFCKANITRLISSAAFAHFMSAFTRDL